MEPMTPLTHLLTSLSLVPTSGLNLVLQESSQHRVLVEVLEEVDELPVGRFVSKISHQSPMTYRVLVGEVRLPACSPLAAVLLPWGLLLSPRNGCLYGLD